MSATNPIFIHDPCPLFSADLPERDASCIEGDPLKISDLFCLRAIRQHLVTYLHSLPDLIREMEAF